MPSDFAQRVAVGVPAAAVAVVLIVLGGPWFAALVLFLGVAAIGELWGMYERVAPVKMAPFLRNGSTSGPRSEAPRWAP